MFTHVRYHPPKFTGDWGVDAPVFERAMSEYWLSLEQKGALAIQPQDISHLPIFAVDDYIAPHHADDTIGITAAAAALSAAGGGVLSFGQGKTYSCWSTNALTSPITLSGLSGVLIQGNGATINTVYADPTPVGSALIYAVGSRHIRVENLTLNGGKTGVATTTGQTFFAFTTGCHGISVINCRANYCGAGIQSEDPGNPSDLVTILNTSFDTTFYPLSFQGVDNVFARVITRNAGRSYFPLAPCANHDVIVDSGGSVMATDCLLKTYANARKGEEYNTLRDVRLHYKTAGARIGMSGVTAVRLEYQQFDTTTASGHMRNIHVSFDADGGRITSLPYDGQTTNFAVGDKVTGQTSGATGTVLSDSDSGSTGTLLLGDCTGTFSDNENLRVSVAGVLTTFALVNGSQTNGPAWADLFSIRKQNSSDAADTTPSRGHTLRNVTVTGNAKNWNTANNGLVFFDVANSQDWSGEQAMCLAVRDFFINGAPVNDCVYVNGKASVAGKPFLDLENVSCSDGTYTEANCSTANIGHRNAVFSNLDAADRRLVAWTPTGNGVTLTVNAAYIKKEDRQVTAFFDVTWPSTADTGEARIGGLPFTVANSGAAQQGFISYTDVGATYTLAAIASTTYGRLFTNAGGNVTNATMSLKRVIGTLVFFV